MADDMTEHDERRAQTGRGLLSFVALAVAVLSGCSSAGRTSPPPPVVQMAPSGGEAPGEEHPALAPEEEETLQLFDEAVSNFDEELSQSIELSTGPDCTLASEVRDRMCELASRVCEIADRHRGDPELSGRCEDGTSRCERARGSVQERCPEL